MFSKAFIKLSFGLSNILFVAIFTVNQINKVLRFTS